MFEFGKYGIFPAAKFETLSEDSSFILRAANVTTLGMPWENSLEKVADGAKTPKVSRDSMASFTASYFAKLNETQIKGLTSIYRIDFEMFGYSINDYSNKTSLVRYFMSFRFRAR